MGWLWNRGGKEEASLIEEAGLGDLWSQLSAEIAAVPDENKFSKIQEPTSSEVMDKESLADSARKLPTVGSQFPDTMSCTQAFDEMVKCYGVGGQVRNVYRYGSMRDCNDRWQAFKFCMFTAIDTEEVQKQKIQQFYRERLAEKLMNGSSEDVWKARVTPLVEPFDKEWQESDVFEAN
ncbi:uncharacterized protein V1510DRAFT_405783 [Dipodascopsis tothii]|uniref:uncharacterized protein n=1 Tax=Dipodascopsis tothii TaxID=44089 RepID=UPI0034CE2530